MSTDMNDPQGNRLENVNFAFQIIERHAKVVSITVNKFHVGTRFDDA